MTLADAAAQAPRFFHICPLHGVEECTWILEPRYRRKPGQEDWMGPDTGARSHCWNEGYGPKPGETAPIGHFCQGWFTGFTYTTRRQATTAARHYPKPVDVCPTCGQTTEDRRANGFDGVDAYSERSPPPASIVEVV